MTRTRVYSPANPLKAGSVVTRVDAEALGMVLKWDAQGPLSSRSDFDGEPEGFTYLQIEPLPYTAYVKRSNTSGDWAAGNQIKAVNDADVEEALEYVDSIKTDVETTRAEINQARADVAGYMTTVQAAADAAQHAAELAADITSSKFENPIKDFYISIGIRNLKKHFGASGSGDPDSNDAAALRNAALSGYYVEAGESSLHTQYDGYNIKAPRSGAVFTVYDNCKLIGVGKPKLLLRTKEGTAGTKAPFVSYLAYFLGRNNQFKNFELHCSYQTQAYMIMIGTKPSAALESNTDLCYANEFENLEFNLGNSGIYCYGSRNRFIDIRGMEMRGSILNFDGDAHHNLLRGLRGRNASGGIGVKGRANNNLIQDIKKWMDKTKFPIIRPNVFGDYAIDMIGDEIEKWKLEFPRETNANLWDKVDPAKTVLDNSTILIGPSLKYRSRARDGFFGGDVCSFTANTFRNRVENAEVSGTRDGGFTLNGYRNVLDGFYIHDTAASASAVVGEDCLYLNGEIDNCLNGYQFRSSFGGLCRRNFAINVIVKNCAEIGLYQIGENANRTWVANTRYQDDPDYILYTNDDPAIPEADRLTSIYNANASGGTISFGSLPPIHIGPVLNEDEQDVGAWDSTVDMHDEDARVCTFTGVVGGDITVNCVNHKVKNGDPVNFPFVNSQTKLPSPLGYANGYIALEATQNTFKVALPASPTVPVKFDGNVTSAGNNTFRTGPLPTAITFTIAPPSSSSLGSLTVNHPGNDLVNGRQVIFYDIPGSPLPAPLKAETSYFVISRTSSGYQLMEEVTLDNRIYPINVMYDGNNNIIYPARAAMRAPIGTRWRWRASIPKAEGFTPRNNYVMGGNITKNAVSDIRKQADGVVNLVAVTNGNAMLSEGDPTALRNTLNTIVMVGTSVDAGSCELTLSGREAVYRIGDANSSDGKLFTANMLVDGASVLPPPEPKPGFEDFYPVVWVKFSSSVASFGRRAAWDYSDYTPAKSLLYDDFDSEDFPRLAIPGHATLPIRASDGMPFDANGIPTAAPVLVQRRTGMLKKEITHRPTSRDAWYLYPSNQSLPHAFGIFNMKKAFTIVGTIVGTRAIHNTNPTTASVFTVKGFDIVMLVQRQAQAALTIVDANLKMVTPRFNNNPAETANWNVTIDHVATSTPRVTRPRLMCKGDGLGQISWEGRFQIFG